MAKTSVMLLELQSDSGTQGVARKKLELFVKRVCEQAELDS